jgi:hypothetical protein
MLSVNQENQIKSLMLRELHYKHLYSYSKNNSNFAVYKRESDNNIRLVEVNFVKNFCLLICKEKSTSIITFTKKIFYGNYNSLEHILRYPNRTLPNVKSEIIEIE